MKKGLLFGMMLLAASSMFAEDKEVTVGSADGNYGGYGANNCPMFSYYECSETEVLYKAADLQGVLPAGKISKIAYAAYGGDSDFAAGYSIWLENTNDTSVGGDDGLTFKSTNDMTLVYKDDGKSSTANPAEVVNGSYDNPGYFGFELAEPFEYTGGGLRIHFRSESYWYNQTDICFVQDLTQIFEGGDDPNCILRYGYGNWGSPKVLDPGRMFPVVKFTVEDTPTAVNDVAVEEVKNVTYYNIYGQKVDADAKGLVISSEGKKFIRK
ncbi:hypothetical protein [Sodaliphilus sp.]|uniref:hypothetical protein n=1 Tax=Sodaliphilus sp. TaxID=2815818 RepID=UPI00388EB8C1